MTKFKEGMLLPKGTPLRVLSVSGPDNNQIVGKVVYATGYVSQGDANRGIPVNRNATDVGVGIAWVTEWELLDNDPLGRMNDDDKKAVSRAAIKAAKARGYCDETKKVLADLGLPTDFSRRRKVVVELEIEETDDGRFNRDGQYSTLISRYNITHNQNVTVVSAKTVSDDYID